ncbi:MAG: hypothetical protein SFV52_12870 [Saprospiraceae bacterium]|nr:hypothetical protein [Saprospiraceae bacterium]
MKTNSPDKQPATGRSSWFSGVGSRMEYVVQHHLQWISFVIGILFIWQFVEECQNDKYTVLPITVPASLDKLGYNKEMVTDRLFEEIRKITDISITASSREAVLLNLISFNQKSIVSLDDPYESGTGDWRGFFKQAKKLFKESDGYVIGHIAEAEEGLDSLETSPLISFVKVNNQAIPEILVTDISQLDSLLAATAESIILHTNPKFLFRYYLWKRDEAKARELLFYIEKHKVKDAYSKKTIQDFVNEIYLNLYDMSAMENKERYLTLCDSALALCGSLKENWGRDIAPYVLEMAICKSKASHIKNYFPQDDPKQLLRKTLYARGARAFKEYNRIWFPTSKYFDKEQALGLAYSTNAYFLYNLDTNKETNPEADEYYKKANQKLPVNAHISNDIAYYLLEIKDFRGAESTLRKIMPFYPSDNNLWDSLAEINYEWSKSEPARLDSFYFCLHRAVSPPDTILGFTPEAYMRDVRWPEQIDNPTYQQAIGIFPVQ